VTQGKTKTEALANIREAIAGYLEVLKEDGKQAPDDSFDYELVAV
jgi:predicted RNase H-like HicB family nuclease